MSTTIVAVAANGARRRIAAGPLLDAAARETVKIEANAWIKRLRLVDYDGQTMRQRFTYRGDSLWWFTEIYLHKTRAFERAIEMLLALEAVSASDTPARLVIETTDPVAQHAARAFGAAHRLTIDIDGTPRPDDRRDRLLGFAVGPSALLSRLRRPPARPERPVKVAAFVHSAFWRDESARASGGRESYVGPVLDEIARGLGPDELVAVGLGPRRNFRSRRWWDPIVGGRSGQAVLPIEQLARRQALTESLDFWRTRKALADAIVQGPGVRAAAWWRQYDLWPVLSTVLARAADVQWPWSARSMDEARAALTVLRPGVAVTYAEAGGWGRALMLEARRAGIPSVGLQHGFIYRHWLNYRHEPDEMTADGHEAGFPRPDLTLVFDGFASHTLTGDGHFPPHAVAVTGSPRLDEIAAEARAAAGERQSRRAALGASDDDRVVVVAAKYTEIAGELPGLAQAVEALPGVHCVIKPHPAESPDVYKAATDASARVRLAPAGVDLGALVPAADALVTRNSTTAIDAMTLGVPAVVVGLPNNLSPFVEAGVMAGAGAGGIRAALEGVLYDRTVRQDLAERARRFVESYGMKADGQAAARAAAAVLGRLEPGEAREERRKPL